MTFPWTDADRRLLAERGIELGEAERQLSLLRRPPPPARLDRAATLGDGVDRLDEEGDRDRLAACRRLLQSGRLTRFVPASGAATRMFRDLLEELDDASLPAEASRRLVEALPRLPFDAQVGETESRSGTTLATARSDPSAARKLARLLLLGGEEQVGLADLPKGLIPFHRATAGDGAAPLSPIEEHAAETRELVGAGARLHFTVAPEHEARFAARLEALRGEVVFDFSHQRSSTDTLALDPDDRPLRDEHGDLVLRPGGHGALIDNLGQAPTDVVAIRNVDNVLPAHRRAERQLWNRRLVGELALIERRLHDALAALHRGGDPSKARRVAAELGLGDLPDTALASALDRPLRVCAMVENLGEPGGGPFWVEDREGGARLQIVESSQIDSRDPSQAGIASHATHFNPTDLVCSLRRWDGRRFSVAEWVDEGAAFVADKSHQGRAIRALERPGLWNGAMAGWLTRFVELPASTFAPVKTVWDLLRPEHQPAESGSQTDC